MTISLDILRNGGDFGTGTKRVSTAVNYTATNIVEYIGVTNTAAPRTIGLYASGGGDGYGSAIVIADESGHASVNKITITPAGADVIFGVGNNAIGTDFGVVTLRSVPGGWINTASAPGWSGAVGNIVYTNGNITSWTANGISYSATYGANGISTITSGGVTKTVSYDANGNFTGIA